MLWDLPCRRQSRFSRPADIGWLSRTEEQEVEDCIPYLLSMTTKRKDKVDNVLSVTVGEIDANGPCGAVGVPAGAMDVVNSFPKGVSEK